MSYKIYLTGTSFHSEESRSTRSSQVDQRMTVPKKPRKIFLFVGKLKVKFINILIWIIPIVGAIGAATILGMAVGLGIGFGVSTGTDGKYI